MKKTTDGLASELGSIHAGRATPALLDNIVVDYHNISTPLRQIANITIPETNMLIIQPWDRTSLRDIERAILKADIGLNPMNDGNIIRMVIPPLSEERRNELVKLVAKRLEARRIALRNIRRDSIDELRHIEKMKDISQDELKNTTNRINHLTESYTDAIAEIGQNKEKEIREL